LDTSPLELSLAASLHAHASHPLSFPAPLQVVDSGDRGIGRKQPDGAGIAEGGVDVIAVASPRAVACVHVDVQAFLKLDDVAMLAPASITADGDRVPDAMGVDAIQRWHVGILFWREVASAAASHGSAKGKGCAIGVVVALPELRAEEA